MAQEYCVLHSPAVGTIVGAGERLEGAKKSQKAIFGESGVSGIDRLIRRNALHHEREVVLTLAVTIWKPTALFLHCSETATEGIECT